MSSGTGTWDSWHLTQVKPVSFLRSTMYPSTGMGRSILGGDHASVTEVSVLFFTTGSAGGWVGGFLGAGQGKGIKQNRAISACQSENLENLKGLTLD